MVSINPNYFIGKYIIDIEDVGISYHNYVSKQRFQSKQFHFIPNVNFFNNTFLLKPQFNAVMFNDFQ